ncbi:hypothetical protein AB595_07070 [Massilia sp. WF1]|uniref:hypothetical protein n=1 Tax=unclassified Massilia TaxID=2609279 RepID=UPI00064B1A9B|nr:MULTISPECIES: hypothetical protein [unclassified Massilia]ALK98356.1 hypothetical protein AM586_21380 [Massilia sp. WG5]KLU37066.1 hypothetical protein AB595_07070 [Massilia sp. WF1]
MNEEGRHSAPFFIGPRRRPSEAPTASNPIPIITTIPGSATTAPPLVTSSVAPKYCSGSP